jgi:hypothetical protein
MCIWSAFVGVMQHRGMLCASLFGWCIDSSASGAASASLADSKAGLRAEKIAGNQQQATHCFRRHLHGALAHAFRLCRNAWMNINPAVCDPALDNAWNRELNQCFSPWHL